MGYELYRLLATRTQRKKRKVKKVGNGPVCIDIEEEDKEKYMLDGEKEMGISRRGGWVALRCRRVK